MNRTLTAAILLVAFGAAVACSEQRRTHPPPAAASPAPTEDTAMAPKWNQLSPEEERVIVHKGTERAFSGEYVDHKADGTYHCRRCDAALFASDAKFNSGTGWPSFDSALPGAVQSVPDADGHRTEIVCARCGAHLGHVFSGERFTDQNVRHCVNSVSLSFEAGETSQPAGPAAAKQTAEAYFAGGCFWGVEHYFEQQPGVLSADSGYMGGHVDSPSYEQVSSKRTGHAETVRVSYDPSRVSYEQLARLFFEIHDPTQVDRQGPDVGSQYRSAVFVSSQTERETAGRLIAELERRGYRVATQVHAAGKFWEAEDYHQDYYERTGKQPYCHARVPRFST